MKQFKLREEKSFVKILKEPPLKKKKVNWSRRLYLAIFIIVLFFFLKRVYNANMIIFANGQIDLPKQTVKFSNDIEILNLFILEGSEVCKGDTLFTYKILGDELDQARISIQNPSNGEWILREQLNIRKKIEINKIIVQQKTSNLLYLQNQIETKESLLLGGVNNEYQQYSVLQQQKASLLADIKLVSKEIEVLELHLAKLGAQERIYTNINTNQLEIYDEIKYFISPLDGVISDIFYEINEICYKKEEMITIHQLKDASINTYFDPEELEYLDVGDVVLIEFPDNSESLGIISKFFVSTYAVPSEFQKKYEPTERNVVAEVVPLNKSDEQSWNSFYKMEVKVQKERYHLMF